MLCWLNKGRPDCRWWILGALGLSSGFSGIGGAGACFRMGGRFLSSKEMWTVPVSGGPQMFLSPLYGAGRARDWVTGDVVEALRATRDHITCQWTMYMEGGCCISAPSPSSPFPIRCQAPCRGLRQGKGSSLLTPLAPGAWWPCRADIDAITLGLFHCLHQPWVRLGTVKADAKCGVDSMGRS